MKFANLKIWKQFEFESDENEIENLKQVFIDLNLMYLMNFIFEFWIWCDWIIELKILKIEVLFETNLKFEIEYLKFDEFEIEKFIWKFDLFDENLMKICYWNYLNYIKWNIIYLMLKIWSWNNLFEIYLFEIWFENLFEIWNLKILIWIWNSEFELMKFILFDIAENLLIWFELIEFDLLLNLIFDLLIADLVNLDWICCDDLLETKICKIWNIIEIWIWFVLI